MLHNVKLILRRFPDVSPAALGLVAVFLLAVLATGIGYLVYR